MPSRTGLLIPSLIVVASHLRSLACWAVSDEECAHTKVSTLQGFFKKSFHFPGGVAGPLDGVGETAWVGGRPPRFL